MRLPAFLEKYIPWLVALPLVIVSYARPFDVPEARIGDFVNSSLTVSALLLGFLATSKSILISYRGSRVFSQLKKTGHVDMMIGYLMNAIISSLLWLLVSFAMYFDRSRTILSAWCFLASFSLASFIRVVLLQGKLIKL
jgi:hypothetical protein